MRKDIIFKSYKPNKNTIFSELSTIELNNFLKLLENYNITFRNKLDLPRNYSFGFEFEMELNDSIAIRRSLFKNRLYPQYQLKREDTVHNGGEIATPILHNIRADWHKVKQVLGIITPNANNIDTCGAHIHIGSQIMSSNKKDWENFLMFWSLYENVITRFLNGEYLNTRLSANEYAKPARELFINAILNNKLDKLEDNSELAFNDISVDRFYVINLNDVSNTQKEELNDTIEFRGANGTFNPIIWQNNLNMIIHLLINCRNLDHQVLLEELKKINNNDSSDYSNIDILKALRFCDIIFHNNLDKINFLRQYFKDFNETKEKELVKSSPFTL